LRFLNLEKPPQPEGHRPKAFTGEVGTVLRDVLRGMLKVKGWFQAHKQGL
jgi:hypothetical protein